MEKSISQGDRFSGFFGKYMDLIGKSGGYVPNEPKTQDEEIDAEIEQLYLVYPEEAAKLSELLDEAAMTT